MAVTKQDVAKLYVALFGRAPEGEGLNYWYNLATKNNWDMAKLANEMFNSAATQFPEYADVQKVVESIYLNVLGKKPEDDPNGIAYWVSEIQNGKTTVGKAAADIIYVAETQYPDHPATKTLENRAEVAVQVAEVIPTADIDGDGQVEADEFNQFKQIIQTVTDDPNTKDTALQQAQQIAQQVQGNQNQGQTFTLTDGIDNITGTAKNDTVKAAIDLVTTANTTWSPADTIDLDGGTDTVDVTVVANKDNGGTALAALSADNVEVLKVRAIYGYEDNNDDDHLTLSLVNFDNIEKLILNNPVNVGDDNDLIQAQNMSLNTTLEVYKGKNAYVNVAYASDAGTNDTAKIALDSATVEQINVNGNIEAADVSLKGDSNTQLTFANALKTLKLSGDGSLNASVSGFLSDTTVYKTVDTTNATGNLTLNVTTTDSKFEFKGGSGKETVILNKANYDSNLKASNVEKILVDVNGSASLDATNLGGATLGVYATSTDDTNGTLTLSKVADNSTIEIMGTGKDNSDMYIDAGLTANINGASSTNVANGVTIKIHNNDTDLGNNSSTEYQFKDLGTITVNKAKAITLEAYDGDVISTGGISGDKLETITIKADEDVIFNNGTGVLGNSAAASLTSIDASGVKGAIKFKLVNDISTENFSYTGAEGADVVSIASQDASDTNNHVLSVNTGKGNDTVIVSDDIKNSGTGNTTFALNLGEGNDTLTLDASASGATSITVEAGSIDFGAGSDKIEVKSDNASDSVDISAVSLKGVESILSQGGTLKLNADSIKQEIADHKVDVTVLAGRLELVMKNETSLDITVPNFNIVRASGAKLNITGTSNGDQITIGGRNSVDTVDGGDGNDTLTITENYTDTADTDIQNVETINVNGGTTALTVNLSNQSEGFTINSFDNGDTIIGGTGADIITTGAGNDNVILKSPFAAADKITDFTSGTDKLYIDLKSANIADKFGNVNTFDTGITAEKANNSKLAFLGLNAKGTKILTLGKASAIVTIAAGKSINNATTNNGAVKVGTKATKAVLLQGSSVGKVISDNKIKIGTHNINKATNSTDPAGKDVFAFFWDTDDKKLKLLLISLDNNAADATLSKIAVVTSKTIATLNTAPSLNDILVF